MNSSDIAGLTQYTYTGIPYVSQWWARDYFNLQPVTSIIALEYSSNGKARVLHVASS